MLVFCDNLTITMISFRVELTLTLLFFTSILNGVEFNDCEQKCKECKDVVNKIGFDEFSNGVYNYCFAHQFSNNAFNGYISRYYYKDYEEYQRSLYDSKNNFEEYLKTYGGFISEKDKRIIRSFFNEIRDEPYFVFYTPWTPRDYCQSLDVHDRDQIVLEVLKNGDCIFHKNDFVNSTDKKYILSPMDFCEQTYDKKPTYLGVIPLLGVWLANYSCARDIKKNKIYGDDPYENLITSYKNQYEPQEEKDEIFINKIEVSGGKTKSNKIKLSGYEKQYYEEHRRSFPELNIILCAKQIKRNGYFGDNEYANLVKSQLYIKRETDKKAKPVYDKLWNSVKQMSGGGAWLKLDDLSEIQMKYYEQIEIKLSLSNEVVDEFSVEEVCESIMSNPDIVSVIYSQDTKNDDEDYGYNTVKIVELADLADSNGGLDICCR